MDADSHASKRRQNGRYCEGDIEKVLFDRETIERAGVQVVDITDKTIPLDFERHAQVHHCFVLRRI